MRLLYCADVSCDVALYVIFICDASLVLRIVCKTGAMSTSTEGPLIATIGEAVVLWETPFKYQVCFHRFISITYWCTAFNTGRLKMQEWKMRYGQNCRGGKCRSGKYGSRSQGWKMQEWKMREQIAKVENAGVSPMDSQTANKWR